MLTSVIDAKEWREVMTVDIPGAFVQGEQDKTIHMKLEGTLAELLAKCDPTNISHIWLLSMVNQCCMLNW